MSTGQGGELDCVLTTLVMPGLVPGIHVFLFRQGRRGWPGRSPAM